jgi:hypothetical protein
MNEKKKSRPGFVPKTSFKKKLETRGTSLRKGERLRFTLGINPLLQKHFISHPLCYIHRPNENRHPPRQIRLSIGFCSFLFFGLAFLSVTRLFHYCPLLTPRLHFVFICVKSRTIKTNWIYNGFIKRSDGGYRA